MLQAVGHVSGQEPGIGIRQVVVNGVATGDRTVVPQGVNIVVSSSRTEFSLQDTCCNELQRGRNDQLHRLGSDQQTTLVRPCGDLNNGGFKRSLVQVSRSSGRVAVGATRNQGVSRVEQGDAITARESGVEAVVQNSSSLGLLGVSHSTGQSLGVTRGQRVIEVVLNCLFSQREAKSNGLVCIASREDFLCVIVGNCAAFVLHRSGGEARQFGFLFKRTLRRLGLIDLFVLLTVGGILKTKQSIQARKKFFK